MDKFGIIGYPLGHSKSPAAFAAAYGGRWRYDLIEGTDFEALWQRFLSGYKAVTVTAPYKEMAYGKADIIAPDAARTLATNLVVKTPEGVKAYNSDYRGVKNLLVGRGFGKGDRALIIGCGGAGKAAAAAAVDAGLDTLVTNRTASKAETLANHLGIGIHPFDESLETDIVIYTIPGPINKLERFRCSLVLEACYANPSYTPELLAKLSAGYIGGREWHYHQAVTGYGIMTGIEPDAESVRKVYEF